MKVIGITGGIATGKSLVSTYLKDLGYPVIDSDQLGHQALEEAEIRQSLIQRFGPQIQDTQTGQINRPALGQVVFGHEDRLDALNQVVHPVIFAKIQSLIQVYEAEGQAVVFIDMPLLYEIAYEGQVDEVWLVYVSPAIQVERLMARNHYSLEEAKARIASQWPIDDKKERSHYVIDNSSSRQESLAQVDQLLAALK